MRASLARATPTECVFLTRAAPSSDLSGTDNVSMCCRKLKQSALLIREMKGNCFFDLPLRVIQRPTVESQQELISHRLYSFVSLTKIILPLGSITGQLAPPDRAVFVVARPSCNWSSENESLVANAIKPDISTALTVQRGTLESSGMT